MAIIHSYGLVQNFLTKKILFIVLLNLEKNILLKNLIKILIVISKIEEITEDEIIKKYNNKFKVIPKNMTNKF